MRKNCSSYHMKWLNSKANTPTGVYTKTDDYGTQRLARAAQLHSSIYFHSSKRWQPPTKCLQSSPMHPDCHSEALQPTKSNTVSSAKRLTPHLQDPRGAASQHPGGKGGGLRAGFRGTGGSGDSSQTTLCCGFNGCFVQLGLITPATLKDVTVIQQSSDK